MLLLILANGHGVGLVEQDVRRHQHWIGVETRARQFAIFPSLRLELRHAIQPARSA